MEAGTPNRQPWTENRNALIGIVAVVAIVALGLILYFALHHSKHNKGKSTVIGPIAYTVKNLKKEAAAIHERFYWAGPKSGYTYEFTRNKKGYLFVRYLPTGTQVGAPGANFLIVTTYPYLNAYQSVKKGAKHKGFKTRSGSFVYVDPLHRTSVYVVFPKINDEIEVYDPSPAIALSTARSGKIVPVLH